MAFEHHRPEQEGEQGREFRGHAISARTGHHHIRCDNDGDEAGQPGEEGPVAVLFGQEGGEKAEKRDQGVGTHAGELLLLVHHALGILALKPDEEPDAHADEQAHQESWKFSGHRDEVLHPHRFTP